MTAALPLILAVIAVISFTACAQEVAYAYGDSGGRPLESGNITKYNGTDIVTSAIASGRYDSSSALNGSGLTVDDIKREIDNKLNVGNPRVRDEGRSLILEYPGDGTINQICSIYGHMVDNWSYARDTRGIEEFQYSNQSLEYGKGKYSGQGDCDDFSILMASLIESIGGTSRIVLAYGPDSGHAYTEVYLGKAGGPESDVLRMVAWLRKNYKATEINTHTDLKTGDVWLNLDWWRGPGGAKHPGGPFFKATSQTPIPIRENTAPAPLKPLNDLPVAQFTISPSSSIVGENASFDASKSGDIGGRIVAYEWDFGDGNKTGKMSESTVNHVYLKGGPCTVILTVEDDEGATSINSQNIMINNPPQANITITPQKPMVGDQVKFDASKSNDAEDSKSLAYHWEINNNSAIFSVVSPPKQVYDEMGIYWINLTVTDLNDAKGHKSILLKINKPPVAYFTYQEGDLNIGRRISFSAASSKDDDGTIVSYAWDFGDNSSLETNQNVQHSYSEGGRKRVKLIVLDNDNASSSYSEDIYLNFPPKALFSYEPTEPDPDDNIIFNASISTDPESGIVKYIWDFGEGREPEVWIKPIAAYAYKQSGKYSVTLQVEDDKRAIGSNTSIIRVGLRMMLVTASSDNTSRIWDVQSGQELHKLSHEGEVRSVAFSRDGQKVATASYDKTARIWDVQSGQELHKLPHEGEVSSVAFSPDGQKVATASDDSTARIWDVQSGQELHKLPHEGSVWSVSFSPDGQKVATTSFDKAARIWDVESGGQLISLPHNGRVYSVAFSPVTYLEKS